MARKKLILIFIFSLFISTIMAQEQREYIIHIDFESRKEIEKITQLVSIDNIAGNTIIAYASPLQLRQLEAKGYSYEMVPKPSLKNRVINMAGTVAEMANWDRYPTYDVYLQMMQQFASNYPEICRLDTIGTSVENRLLLAVKISDNVNTEEAEAEAFYTATMHGDELVGITLHLRLIDYLLSNYGSDAEVDSLINNMEIWINPISNPDGTYAGGNNTVSGSTRYNANGVDLNRNFPDPQDGEHPDGNAWQPENIAMMDFADAHTFVLSQNTHSGEEVVNYPWDTWSRHHADHDWWQFVSHRYADTVHANASSGYLDGFNDGITNGYDWYTISGGRQDYMNYFKHCREFTLELSMTKKLSSDALPAHWDYNQRSLINYLKAATYGIAGIVTNTSGTPLDAKIHITDHDADNSFAVTDPDVGDYHRPLAAGTYTIEISAEGYIQQTFENITVSQDEVIFLNAELAPADIVTISGKVVDALTAKPVENATLTFEDETIAPASTDASGNYTVADIAEGRYNIAVTADNYATRHKTIDIAAGNMNFDFQLLLVKTIDFEDSNLPDEFTTEGDALWTIDPAESYSGTQSSRSGEITHNQQSTLSFQHTYESPADISFALKTSCEGTGTFYDYLQFFIDGNSQGKWNGETAWTEVLFPVTPGTHTFTWKFKRDGSVGEGANAAWIDRIRVPKKNRLFRLVSERDNLKDELVVGFYENADDGFDTYDSEKMFAVSDEYPQIYTIVDNHFLAINGYSFLDTVFKSVPMGFRVYHADTITLTAPTIDTFTDSLDVYLYDATEDSLIDWRKQNTYQIITTGTVETDTRFKIYFADRNSHRLTLNTSGEWPSITKFYHRITIADDGAITVPGSRTNARCKTLTLQPGARLTVGGSLTVSDSLVVESALNETQCASIIAQDNLQVNGHTEIRRTLGKNRWWYFTSPVANTAAGVAHAADQNHHLYYWDETLNNGWTEITSDETPLQPLTGYACYPENTGNNTLTFNGTLQTGSFGSTDNLGYTSGNDKAGYHLLGNPYPSYISLGTETNAPGIVTSNLSPTIWYRSNGNFYTYNRSGDGVAQEGASRYVAPGQAFWVHVENSSGGTFRVENNARTHASQQYLKNSSAKLLRIFASHRQHQDELVIRFIPQAETGFDRYDSRKWFTDNTVFPQIYAPVDTQSLAIVSQPLTKNETTIRLGLKTQEAGTYTISKQSLPGVLTDYAVMLYDKHLHKNVNLNSESYTFQTATAQNWQNRFFIKLQKSSTGTDAPVADDLRIHAHKQHLYIHKNTNSSGKLFIYNIQGQQVMQHELPAGRTDYSFELPFRTGIYILQIIMPDVQKTQKICVQ